MNKSHNIRCMTLDNYSRGKARDWEITADGKLWPCCKFVTDLYPESQIRNGNPTTQDLTFMHRVIMDPDWNNVFKNSINDILNDPLYKDYIAPAGWESDNPPVPCLKYCNLNAEERDKKHTTRFNQTD